MPILDLQKRARELGRIRIGQQVPTGNNGKTRPAKLDKFRITSASRPLLEKVATLYGGTAQEWTPANGGPSQWEVFTDSNRLPILVPPQPVSQWYELWSGGGCQRRCDGQREIIRETPCVCAQADERACKPTTRLNVVLSDVEGLGVFRLESHGYYAAVELPNVAGFLEQAGGYVEAFLVLEERVVKRDGEKPKRFMVPAIEIQGVTPRQLIQGQVVRPAVRAGEAPQPVTGARPALEAGGGRNFVAEIKVAATKDDVLAIWQAAKDAQAPNGAEVQAAATARATELDQAAAPVVPAEDAREKHIKAALAATSLEALSTALADAQAEGFCQNLEDDSDELVAAFVGRRRALDTPAQPEPAGDRDALWQQVIAAWPGDKLSEIETALESAYDVKPGEASADHLARFLADIKAGATQPANAGAAVPF